MKPTTAITAVQRNLIGSEWCEMGDAIQRINSADTRETAGLYARGGIAEAELAVAAARAAFSRAGKYFI